MAAYWILLVGTTVLLALLVQRLLSLLTLSRRAPLPPGPKGWPILGNLPQLGAKPHQTLSSLSRKHGPLFSLHFGSVHVVVAASASVAAAFLKTHDANFSNRPPNSGAEHVAYNYRDMVFAPHGSLWRALRRICSVRLFTAKAMDEFSQVREEEAAELVRALLAGGSVELGQMVNVCAVNALSRAVMGRRVFGNGLGKEAEEFKKMVVELMQVAGVFNVGDFVPWLAWADPQGVVAKMKGLHRRYDELLNSIMKSHEANVGTGNDLLSSMMGMRGQPIDKEGTVISDVEIKAVLLNLFTAGTDTTSSTVEWAMAELIRHPSILKAAREEIDAVVGKSRLVSDSDLNSLIYLQAVVKEVFRLHPPTPLSLPRMAAESCEINGYHIPKNATLLVNVWAIARDPDEWPRPLEFLPSRFLPGGDHADADVKGTDFELIPFGAGRRVCVGMSLGLRVVQFLTATLVHAFDWELPPGLTPEKLDMEEAYGLTLQRAVPLNVRPVPRLNKDAYATLPTGKKVVA
ncbi:cytochrome P450 superfamily protein [Wolffia australiana]